MTKAVTEGFCASVFTALGSLTAVVSIMTLSFTGLGVVIASSELAFNIIKWSGAIYLLYLGYKALTSKQETYTLSDQERKISGTSKKSLYMSGFIVGASNPKAIVFFTALFPQFINLDESLITQYAVYAVTFAVLELIWLFIYSYLGVKCSNWLLREGRATFFNRITGGIFIGAGIILTASGKTPA
jgi:threonine/homoserine/homoserine lactone efflux protein